MNTAIVAGMFFLLGLWMGGCMRRAPLTKEQMFAFLVSEKMDELDREAAKQAFAIDFDKEVQKRRKRK